MKKKHEDNVLKFPAERKSKKEISNTKGFALFNEGLYFYNSDKYDTALKKFLLAEQEGCKSAEMFADMAYLYKCNENDGKSLIYIKKSLKIDNEYGYAHSLLGKYYSGKKMKEKALKHLLLSEKYDFIDMYSIVLISLLYDEPPVSNYMKALEYAAKAVDYFPDEPYVYMNKAQLYYSHQEYEKALKYLKKADSLKYADDYDGEPDCYFQTSYCYSMLGKPGKAVEYANKLIFLDKINWKGYYRKGFAYFMNGADKQAVKSFLLAEKYGCTNSDMYTRLAYCYVYSDAADFDKAVFYANKALELNKDDADALFILGCAMAELKSDCETALKYYKKYLESVKVIPPVEFYENYCTSLYLCGLYKKADFYVTDALAVYSDSEILKDLKEKITASGKLR